MADQEKEVPEKPAAPDDRDLSSLNEPDEQWDPPAAAKPEPKRHTQAELDLAGDLGIEGAEALTASELHSAMRAKIKTQKEPETPEPKRWRHAPAIVQAARAVGLTDHDIADMPPRELAGAISALRQDAPAKKAVVEDDDDEEAIIAHLEKEGMVDPKAAKLLRKQAKSIKDLKGSMEKDREEAKARLDREMQRRKAAAFDAIDQGFAALGSEYESIVGKGPGTALKRDGEEMEIRLMLLNAGRINLDDDDPATIKSKIEAVAKKLYGKAVKKPAAKPAEKPNGKHSKEEWDEAALAATTATDPDLTPREKTLRQKAQDFMRERGISNRDSHDDAFDSLPD